MTLRVPSLFSDHALLQRSGQVPVWGWAEPGAMVTVSLGVEERQDQADPQGRWQVQLDLSNASAGPHELIIEAGTDRFVIHDVIIGEVWLASGQSNMEWPVRECLGADEAVEQAERFRIREFHVDQTARAKPQNEVPGRWSIAGPDTVSNFSAVAYAFAQKLERALDVPIGIVHSSWGGSNIEAWIAPERLNPAEHERAARDHRQVANVSADRASYVAAYSAWEKRYYVEDPGSPEPEKFAGPDVDDRDWQRVELPGKLGDQGLPDAGVTWLRKTVTIPKTYARANMHVHIDVFRDFEAIYVNGEMVRETTPASPHHIRNGGRSFHLPVTLREGENTFAVRLFSPVGGAEISEGSFLIEGAVSLAGEWRARSEQVMAPVGDEARAAQPQPPSGVPGLQNIPGALHNGMIAPLVPFALAGAIWYQGESNTGESEIPLYPIAFQRMVEDLRRRFLLPELPFYYCQLPEFMAKTTEFPRAGWAEFREVQALSQTLPHVGMAVLLGLGEADDIHPRDKLEVGARLARLALAKTYGAKIVADAPQYERFEIEDREVRLSFHYAEEGLEARQVTNYIKRYSADFIPSTAPTNSPSPGDVQGFALCGADRQWAWAEARIERDSILVWSDQVPAPVAVRYAWANNPTCNVFSGAGLPLAPFRTDDFPLA